ncbi:MAG: HEAT repeat domain-containing protein, partial [Gemmataceae bacterium]
EAYYRAGSSAPETATMIRCQALTALGETKQPAALDVLVKVLREPPVEGPDQDKDLKLRERIAASKAMGGFNQYQATAALVDVLRKEDDEALKNNAHKSLIASTGRRLPADPQLWAEFLHNPKSVDRSQDMPPNIGDKIMELTGLK